MLLAATKHALEKAGAMGGSLGAFGSLGAERGGSAGGRFGARFTRARTAAAVLKVKQDAEVVRERARRAIAEHGALIDDPDGAGDGAVWGVVRSGPLDMVPAPGLADLAGRDHCDPLPLHSGSMLLEDDALTTSETQ